MAETNIYAKLAAIQSELKAPKNQYNPFGKYNYRNCEDILEALKPLLLKNKCTLTISDEVVQSGERYYIRAIATLIDTESKDKIEVNSYAREEETKKGMDGAQVTGSCSSYARKYALNGLFGIDDNKDSDTTNKTEKGKSEEKEYKCCDCGKPFESYTSKAGKSFTPGQCFHMAENNNEDGKARCRECRAKKYGK